MVILRAELPTAFMYLELADASFFLAEVELLIDC